MFFYSLSFVTQTEKIKHLSGSYQAHFRTIVLCSLVGWDGLICGFILRSNA